MKYKHKVKMARKMRTKGEIEIRTPIFLSNAWEKRKRAVQERVKLREQRSKK